MTEETDPTISVQLRRYRRCDRCGLSFAVQLEETLCANCDAQLEADYPEPIRSPTYVYADCGCEYRDNEKTKWCAHHVSNLTEAIKAREREATDLRYRVRELEAEREGLENDVQTQINVVLELVAERDEWKAKAEREAAMGRDADNEVQRLREDVVDWKAKAERAETEHQNALQDGSICPDPDEHATIRILREQKRILIEENRRLRRHQEELQKEIDALQDAVKHLRDQVPDNGEERDGPGESIPYWHPGLEKAAAMYSPTHYCCMHMRWETQRGEKV